LREREREFRFEILFTTPEIFMSGDGAPWREGQVLIDGSINSRKLTMIPTKGNEINTRITGYSMDWRLLCRLGEKKRQPDRIGDVEISATS
jgi:hypothetical protein